jgi:NNP family nitrate/nitrite transporter-like MFS transporter
MGSPGKRRRHQTGARPVATRPLQRNARASFAAALLGLALGFNFGNIGPIAERVSVDYGIGLAAVGVMTMLLALVHSAVQIPSGRLVDRVRPRHAALAGLGIVLVCNSLALIAPEPWLAMPLRALMGVGTGLGFIAGTQYIREIGAVAQGVFGGAALGGAGLAVAVMPVISDAFDTWRSPWLAGIGLVLVSMAVFAISPRGPAAVRRSVVKRATQHVSSRPLFRDPGLYRLAAMHAAGMGLAIVVANWVVTLLTRTGGFDIQLAGILGSLTLLLGIATRPLGGWILHNRPQRLRASLVASMTICAAGTVLLATGGPLPVVAIGAILIGLGAGIPFAPAFTGAALRRPEAPGTAVGLVNTLGNGVVVVGTPLLGLSFSLPSDGRIGFAIVAAIWLGALLVLPSNEELGIRVDGQARGPR